MSECIFCKIINKTLSADIVCEDKDAIVIKDIHPKASVHFLIIPKKHIESITAVGPEDKEIISALIFVAKKIAKAQNLKGYKLLFNVGREAGQTIDHLHLHLLSGEIVGMP